MRGPQTTPKRRDDGRPVDASRNGVRQLQLQLGCPCQFGAPSTHGYCAALVVGHIDEGNFNATKLDGLDWALLLSWPGEIAEGNGTQQAIIDERADSDQREALRKILHGESTTPGATHFFVYNSTMSKVLDTLYEPSFRSTSMGEPRT
jgi:hypothetical protein